MDLTPFIYITENVVQMQENTVYGIEHGKFM